MVVDGDSEIWGATSFKEAELVQLDAGRRLLGVSKKTSNAVVRGELGWWTMRAQRDMKMLMYWARLVRMEDSRLVKQVYVQRRNQKGKKAGDWCMQVKKILVGIGIGDIWDSELVGTEKEWKRLVRTRIQEREEKHWIHEMHEKDKLRLYRVLKCELEEEEFLHELWDREERRALVAMRGGTNVLRVETGRWIKEKLKDRTCNCASG